MTTILDPRAGELDADQVRDAYPWPDDRRSTTWVRAMMVTTLDGAAAGPDGRSGSISSSADKAVFDAVRRLADVVLVGAGTLRAERYGPIRPHRDDADLRAAAGQAPAPRLAIVSGSLDLPWDDELFSEPAHRPLVLTGRDPDPERAARARARCELVVLDEPRPGAPSLLAALVARGLRRMVCEGGPTLLESFVAADLLDEADITVSPLFAGTARTPRTGGLDVPARFELRHVLSAGGFLMCRYTR